MYFKRLCSVHPSFRFQTMVVFVMILLWVRSISVLGFCKAVLQFHETWWSTSVRHNLCPNSLFFAVWDSLHRSYRVRHKQTGTAEYNITLAIYDRLSYMPLLHYAAQVVIKFESIPDSCFFWIS